MKTELKIKKDIYDFLYQVKTFLGLNKKRFSEENLNLIFNLGTNEEIINTEQKHNILESFFYFCHDNKTLSIDDFLKTFQNKTENSMTSLKELNDKINKMNPTFEDVFSINSLFLDILGMYVNYRTPIVEIDGKDGLVNGQLIMDFYICDFDKMNHFLNFNLEESNNIAQNFLDSLSTFMMNNIKKDYQKLMPGDVSFEDIDKFNIQQFLNINLKCFDFVSYFYKNFFKNEKNKKFLIDENKKALEKILSNYSKKLKDFNINHFEIDIYRTMFDLNFGDFESYQNNPSENIHSRKQLK